MKQTSNYKFNLPAESDVIDINILNDNFNSIDTELKEHDDTLKSVTLSNSLDIISATGTTSFYHGTLSGFFDTSSLLSEINTTFGAAVFGNHYGTFSATVGSSVTLYIKLYAEDGQIKWDEYYNTTASDVIKIGTAYVVASSADTSLSFSYTNNSAGTEKKYTLKNAIVELALRIETLKGLTNNG